MVTVPRVSQASESLRPLRPVFETNAGASIEAFGGGRANTANKLAQGITDFGDSIGAVALDIQRKDNERAAKDLEVQYRNDVRKILYGDVEGGQVGYYGLKGQAALDAAVPTQEALQKVRETLLNSAGNKAVREMFDQTSTVLQMQQFEGLTRYSTQERQVADEATRVARMNAAADDAYANPDNETLATSLATVQAEVFEQADREGWTEEQMAQGLKEAQSKVYSAAIVGAMRSDPDRAMAIWDQNKGGMTAADRAKVEPTLYEITATSKAQTIVDEVYSKGGSREAMAAEIRRRLHGVAEDKAIAELNQRVQEERSDISFAATLQSRADAALTRAIAQEERDLRLNTQEATRQATEAVIGGATLNDWLRENPEQAQYITQDYIKFNALTSLEKNVAEGKPVETDWDYYNKVTVDAVTNPDTILNIDPSVARAKLGDTEFKQFTALQAQAAAGKLDPKNPTTPTAMFNARASELGLDESKKREQKGRLQSIFLQEIERAEAANGRKVLTSAETREILDSLTDEVVIQDYYFGSIDKDARFYEVEIPDTDRAQIIEAFQEVHKRRPSGQEIVDLWRKSQTGGQ